MKNQPYVKITFTGDIMCDMHEIPVYKTETGEYDFSSIFEGVTGCFSDSDYVVGNLETPVANAEYSYEQYSFNAPVEFAKAIKRSGISMVTTANNHCLDRGICGLEDTNINLDAIGLKHTGTNNNKCSPSGIVEEIGGMKIGFLSYTYGTNAFHNKCYLGKNEKWKVNLYQEQELHNMIYRRFYYSYLRTFTIRAINKIGRLFFNKNIICLVPVYERTEKCAMTYKKMKNDICSMKNEADYVIMCLHSGGQYNHIPLKNTKEIARKIVGLGVDAVIINHEHVIHYGEIISGKPVIYCLGNFTSRTGVHEPPYDKMADYSILLNLYLYKEGKVVKPLKITFSILKTITEGYNRVKTVLLFDLIKDCTDKNKQNELLSDNLKIYNLFRNSKENEIELQLEYLLV